MTPTLTRPLQRDILARLRTGSATASELVSALAGKWPYVDGSEIALAIEQLADAGRIRLDNGTYSIRETA